MTRGASWFLYFMVAFGFAAIATSASNPDADSASGIPFLLGAASVLFLPGLLVAAIASGVKRARGPDRMTWHTFHRIMWGVLILTVVLAVMGSSV